MAVSEKEATRTQAAAPQPPPDDRPWQGYAPAGSRQVEAARDEEETAERYRRARARVQELRGFYTHVFMYVLVNLALLAINLITSPGYLWCLWVMIGWGVGLASHAFVVFGAGGLLGKDWEDRKVREFMERDEGR